MDKIQVESYADIDKVILLIDSAATDAINKRQEFYVVYGTEKDITSAQNSALHLWFTQCADTLNDAGLQFTKKALFSPGHICIDWDAHLFKREVYKPTLMSMIEKTSTQHQSVREVDRVISQLYRFFSEHGVTLPEFPNKNLIKPIKQALIA